ncbi:hypothetical protein [Rhizobacter sp. LjRoot28]|uniref:hypothetical protein n=1 Tax=Rhizobacter sp. LjRoot28 TaxID=3342309 RepID=UPI003ECE5A43
MTNPTEDVQGEAMPQAVGRMPRRLSWLVWIGLAIGVTVSVLSLQVLATVVVDLVSDGMVLIPRSRSREPDLWVTWPHAWAYMVGNTLLFAGGLSCVAACLGRKTFGLFALTLLPLGGALVLLSRLLSTFAGVGILVVLGSVFVVNRRFGKVAAVGYWAAIVGLLVLHEHLHWPGIAWPRP